MGISPLKTPVIDLHQIWQTGSPRRPNHPWQFFGNRPKGFYSVRGRILPFSYLQAVAINTGLALPRSLWKSISMNRKIFDRQWKMVKSGEKLQWRAPLKLWDPRTLGRRAVYAMQAALWCAMNSNQDLVTLTACRLCHHSTVIDG